MENLDQKLVKIIGAGRVVQAVFHAERSPINCEIYDLSESRGPFTVRDIASFEPTNSLTIFCASAQEAELVQKFGESRSRLAVAEANLSIVHDFLKKGIFDKGIILVITNPSDLIAEYIYRESSNKNVYALGLGVDKRRCEEILLKAPENNGVEAISMAGNHYDFPYPILKGHGSDDDADKLVGDLRKELKVKIEGEFDGFSPPVKSGASTLLEALEAISTDDQIFVSGYCDDLQCFSGGVLDGARFTPSIGNSLASRKTIQSIAEKHRQTYQSVIRSLERKLQCGS